MKGSTWILPLLLLLYGAEGTAQGADPAQVSRLAAASGLYPFVFFGRVLLADAHRLEVRTAGRFSPAALQVAADPAGRIWGRLEPRHLAALDPERDQVLARIRLKHKPGLFLITPGGKAYVTHRSPTRGGFPVSVVDTLREQSLGQLQPVAGRAEDLAQAGGFVFAAALGVLRQDPMQWHLYRIDETTEEVREVLSTADTDFSWKLAAAGGRLYIGYLPAPDNPHAGRVEARDARTLAVLGQREAPRGALRALHATEAEVLLFCASSGPSGGESTELLRLDPLLGDIVGVRSLEGPVARVLGLSGPILAYLDHAFEAGNANVSLCFYDLEAGLRRKRINLRELMQAEGTE